jgi:hypothetical protein
VEITFEGGTQVAWQKGKKVNRYKINNDDWLEKVSHGVPPEVMETLKVGGIKAGNSVLWPQLAPQFTGQVFLFDKPGSVLAEAVADVERVGRLNKALKSAESDLRKAKSTLKLRVQDAEEVEADIQKFEGFSDVERQVEDLLPLYSQAEKTRRGVAEIIRLREDLLKEKKTIDLLSGVEEVSLPGDSDFDQVRQLRRDVETLLSLKGQRKQAQNETAEVGQAVEAFEKVDLSDSPEKQASKTYRSHLILLGMQQEIKGAQKEISVLEDRLEGFEEELRQIEQEIQSNLKGLGNCPLCGTTLGEKE